MSTGGVKVLTVQHPAPEILYQNSIIISFLKKTKENNSATQYATFVSMNKSFTKKEQSMFCRRKLCNRLAPIFRIQINGGSKLSFQYRCHFPTIPTSCDIPDSMKMGGADLGSSFTSCTIVTGWGEGTDGSDCLWKAKK